jgi:hypothetical protein
MQKGDYSRPHVRRLALPKATGPTGKLSDETARYRGDVVELRTSESICDCTQLTGHSEV